MRALIAVAASIAFLAAAAAANAGAQVPGETPPSALVNPRSEESLEAAREASPSTGEATFSYSRD